MLNQRSIEKTVALPRNQWGEHDWDLIAAELKRRFPMRNFSWYDYSGYSLEDFEDAMEGVIPQGRHKSFGHFDDVRHDLFNAFRRVNSGQVVSTVDVEPETSKEDQSDKRRSIRWSSEQWELVVLNLHKLRPTAFADNLATIGNKDANAAQQALDPKYHRKFVQVVGFRITAMKVFQTLSEQKRLPAPPPAQVQFTTGIVSAPIPAKRHERSALATAMHEAFERPVLQPKRKKHVHWNDEDWLKIAAEMLHQNPHGDFFNSGFHAVELAAIRSAQRVVFPLEHRRNISASSGLREPLVKAFKTLKANLEAAENVAVQQQEEVKVQFQDAPTEVKEVAQTKVEEVAVQAISNVMQGHFNDFATKFAVSLAPVISLVSCEIAKALVPELTKALKPMFDEAIKSAKQSLVQPAPASFTEQAAVLPITMPAKQLTSVPTQIVPAKPKKPKIAVLGPYGQQRNDLEQAFPDYDFVYIENGHGIKEAGINCELFVAAVPYMNASNKKEMKAIPPEKLKVVATSGISSFKHQIKVWLAQKSSS